MSPEKPIDLLEQSILEDVEVDWDRAEAEAERGDEIGRVRALRDVARIVAFHRTLQRDPDAEGAPAVEHDGS